MALRLAWEGRAPEAIAEQLRGSAERRCARISGNATRQKRKGGRSHPSQTTIAEGHQGYRSLLSVCRSSPGAQGFDAHEIFSKRRTLRRQRSGQYFHDAVGGWWGRI